MVPLRIVEAIGGRQRIFGDHVREDGKIVGHALKGNLFVGKLSRAACRLEDLGVPGWQDFFNHRPGATLNHEIFQVKFGCWAICGCEEGSSRILNALFRQGGEVKAFLDHSIGMRNSQQFKIANNRCKMIVEQIVLQQVIRYLIRKSQSCCRPVDQALKRGSADTNLTNIFCFRESGKEELFLFFAGSAQNTSLAETLISLGNCRQIRFAESGMSGPHLQSISSSTYDHNGCGKQ